MEEFLSAFRTNLAGNEEPCKAPAKIESGMLVLLSIWRLDDSDQYYEKGYSVKEIAPIAEGIRKSNFSVPLCQSFLDSLVDQKEAKSLPLSGGTRNGLHYSLTVTGRKHIIDSGLID